MSTRAMRRGAGAVLALVLLAGCGDDGGDDAASDDAAEETTTEAETSTTTEAETTTTTTTEATTTTTEAPVAVAACDAVGADQVAAVLGAGASAGEPASATGSDEGCVWRSASGTAVMGATVVASSEIPDDADAAVLFPRLGLSPDGYASTTVSRSSSGGRTALVVVGFDAPPDEAASDAVSAVGSALLGA